MNLAAALLLWLSMAVLMLANNAIGDTIIAGSGGAAMAELYKTVVPLPYIALCAWIYCRRIAKRSSGALLGIGLLWAVSTIMVDVIITRLLQGQSWRLATVHYQLWDGYWFALVPVVQFLAPLLAGKLSPPGGVASS